MSPAAGAWTGVVELGRSTCVIKLGVLKLARFKRLKSSARNCRFSLSRIRVSFLAEKSQVANPGPRYSSRPTFPKNPLLFGWAVKAAGLNHWFGFPRTTGPVNAGFRNTRTGLSVSPLFEGL